VINDWRIIIMHNFIYLALLVFIVIAWSVSIRYLLPYLHKKNLLILNRKEKGLLFCVIILIFIALIYTYIQTNGTFIW
jgi:hypothetical protein